MKANFWGLFIAIGILVAACRIEKGFVTLTDVSPKAPTNVSRIAFGSCAKQDKDQPILLTAAAQKPDIFVFLGDNVYCNTTDMDKMAACYAKWAAKSEFQTLTRSVYTLAVWDDHDYGDDDLGSEYPQKEASKQIFRKFWGNDPDDQMGKHPGIYRSYTFGETGKRVQFILLDTRTFRSALLPANGKPYKNDYRPNPDPAATMLGAEQWDWLRQTLQQPANLRIVCSSTQFGVGYNGYEAWCNFPLEQEKMFNLIRETKAEGLLFISGDVHYAELSKMTPPTLYPIYDLTSSGITQTWPFIQESSTRQGQPFGDNNFGLIEIDWNAADPVILLIISDKQNQRPIKQTIPLSQLRF